MRVLLGIRKADRGRNSDGPRHRRRRFCDLVVDHEIKPHKRRLLHSDLASLGITVSDEVERPIHRAQFHFVGCHRSSHRICFA